MDSLLFMEAKLILADIPKFLLWVLRLFIRLKESYRFAKIVPL